MTDNPECSRCSKQVQNSWKYCRFCGNKLDQIQNEIETTQEHSQDVNEIPDKEHEVPKQQFDFDRGLYYDVLTTRAERSVILKQKDEIRDEINSLLEQIQSGLIDEQTALPKVKELRQEVKEINNKTEEFSDLPDELPVEVLNDQINAAEKRLRKIKMLKEDKNISRDTIQEAKARTEESLNILRDQQSKLFGHIRSWKNDLVSDIEEIRKEIELLYVRYKTDEITEEAYKEKKQELVNSIKTDEEVVGMLKNILSQ